jgi:hypothetical protein
MAALLGADAQRGLTLKRARELRLPVLERLLPAPDALIPAKELKKFKEKHRDRLHAFRDCVDEELIRAASLKDEDAQEEQARLAGQRLARDRDTLVEAMRERRWPRIVFGGVGGLVAAGAALATPLVGGESTAAVALGSTGLLPAIHTAYETFVTRPDLSKPMAYAALVQERLAR